MPEGMDEGISDGIMDGIVDGSELGNFDCVIEGRFDGFADGSTEGISDQGLEGELDGAINSGFERESEWSSSSAKKCGSRGVSVGAGPQYGNDFSSSLQIQRYSFASTMNVHISCRLSHVILPHTVNRLS